MFVLQGLYRARVRALWLVFSLGVLVPTWVAAANCTHCKASLAPDALFCGLCGTRVEATAPAHLYCWHCGTEQPVAAKFCSRCGAALDTSALPAPAAADSTRPGGEKSATAAVTAAAATAQPAASQPAKEPGPWDAPAGESGGGGPSLRLRPREIVLPPQVFEAPTGDILPSLTLHISGGLSFGFSDDHQSENGILRFGLGGLAEALVSTSNVVHIVDVSSSALLGFRLRVPTGIHTPEGKERLRAAFNLAASDDHQLSDSGAFTSADGVFVYALSYSYQETTAGLALTWVQNRARYHAAVHATDLRATGILYRTVQHPSQVVGGDQREVHTSFAAGFDYAANPRTWFLAEVTSSPQIEFAAATGELQVESRIQYGLGVRFFPDPLLALDSSLHLDDDAVGLGDVRIGFGLHLILSPHTEKAANPAAAKPQ